MRICGNVDQFGAEQKPIAVFVQILSLSGSLTMLVDILVFMLLCQCNDW